MSTAIELRGVRKAYARVVALDDVDLDVAEGEILGLLGPNGAGKSTLVECVAGLRRPDAGAVRVFDFDPADDRRAATGAIGVQLQQAGQPAKMTVRESLRLHASFHRHALDGVALAERLGLGDKLDARFTTLSGGQQQRLAVALALVGRPRVALLDELSTGLDPRSRRDVWAVVEEARDGGTTVLLVTHLMEEANHLCDRLALVADGRIQALDSPSGLVGRSGAPTTMSFAPDGAVELDTLRRIPGVSDVDRRGDRVELGADDDAVLAVLDHLGAAGVRPRGLRVTEATLDEAYLDLVSGAEADAAGPTGTDHTDHTDTPTTDGGAR